jgi:amino acid adenylation domain-containing protein
MTFARLLPQLLDRAAEAGPERKALSDGTVRLSYGEAASRANQLAHLLVEEGARSGDRVGICLPRCLESAIAVYGILKAGAAFVPIDPSTPPAGIRQLLRDCDIRHLITHDSLARALGEVQRETTPLRCVIGPKSAPGDLRCRSWSDLEAHDGGAAPDRRILADDLAYIMYSSGSTGRPKGIMHTHRSGLAYAQLSVDTYGVTAADRIANHSPLHFDMSTFGYFSSICAGATTIIIPEAHTKLAASLAQLVEAEGVTIWYSVPLALIQLATRGGLDQRDLAMLRWVLFGGEPFPPDHLKALMQLLPGARFSNVYGPAEVNQCTYHHLSPVSDPTSEAARGLPVPIGDLWAEAEGLILEEADQPVTDGEPGELVVRTSTMMQGYWARPDLNAKAFYRRPAAGGAEHVFYRTGDLVRRREDGRLEFLGRKDRQVKIRGYRVELDEIEHHLSAHPAVDHAAVFPVGQGDGTKRIEAAVTLGESATEAAQLQAYLSQVFPWYAVPERVTILPSLPRTATDKIDRRQLQAMAESGELTH